MTNESFWRELEKTCHIFPLAQTVHDEQALTKQQIRAVSLLRQGYRENLDLVCVTRVFPDDPTCAGQLYMGDFEYRALICFTSMENARRSTIEMGSHRVETLPCRFVLSNMITVSYEYLDI